MKDIVIDERAAWPRKRRAEYLYARKGSRLSSLCHVTDRTAEWRVRWNKARKEMLKTS